MQTNIWINLGRIFDKQKDYDRAIEWISKIKKNLTKTLNITLLFSYLIQLRNLQMIQRGMNKMKEMDEKAYQKWEKKGRISLKNCDISFLIGFFVLGWLAWVVYDRAGKSGWKIFVPMIFFEVLGIYFNPIFFIISIIIYIFAWNYIRGIIKIYEEKYEISSEKKDYTNLDWLKMQYYELNKNIQEIAEDQNVSMVTIKKWIDKLDIREIEHMKKKNGYIY